MEPLLLSWQVAPVWLLAGGLLFESLRPALRRKAPSCSRWLAWAIRPWTAWALFNLGVRWQHARGFNNPATFPFFANTWSNATFLQHARHLLASPNTWCGLVAATLVALLLLLLARTIPARAEPTRPFVGAALAATALLGVLFALAVNTLPDGIPTPPDSRQGALVANWKAHSTVLYGLPKVRSTSHFLRHFQEIQPDLRKTIHAYSHPPGAVLSLYWIGEAMGADRGDIRDDRVRLRYLLGLTLFGALNVPLLYLLGQGLFGTRRIGLLTALLWVTMPATVAYTTFAQDTVYAVFFNCALLLTWRLGREVPSHAPRDACLLGAVFYGLTMLKYSWCVVTTVFTLFLLYRGARARWAPKAWLTRLVLPLAVMTLLLLATILHYGLDYLDAFRVSRAYVGEWYRLTGGYQWLLALLGGQVDLWLMTGSVTCSALLVALATLRRSAPPAAAAFLLFILFVYAVPLLAGPPALKMETARVWSWIVSVPLAFAAAEILRQRAAHLFVLGALAVSMGTGIVLRLFLNFAP